MFALFHTIFQDMRKYLQFYNEFIRMDVSQFVFLAEKLTTFIIKKILINVNGSDHLRGFV